MVWAQTGLCEYADIAPWYDKTEELVGVCGTNTGLDDMPDSAPGRVATAAYTQGA